MQGLGFGVQGLGCRLLARGKGLGCRCGVRVQGVGVCHIFSWLQARLKMAPRTFGGAFHTIFMVFFILKMSIIS